MSNKLRASGQIQDKDRYIPISETKRRMVSMLTEIQLEIEECVDGSEGSPQFEQGVDIARCQVVDIIQQKIDKLKEVQQDVDK